METLNRQSPQPPQLFNSALETGLRAIVVLEAVYPRQCGLIELTWFDYLVVHSGDAGGPESLHPDLPARAGELLVRRRVVEQGIRLMQRVHLVDEMHLKAGICYVASDDAPSFVDLLQAPYFQYLKERARWVAERFGKIGEEEIKTLINDRIGRWTAEFNAGALPPDSRL
jgi:hypothetical protein